MPTVKSEVRAAIEEALSLLRSAPGPLRQTPPFRLLAGELALR